jgi:hypothetical protein
VSAYPSSTTTPNPMTRKIVSEPLSLRRSGTARGGGRTQGDREERSAGGRNLDIGGGVVEEGTLEIISDGG